MSDKFTFSSAGEAQDVEFGLARAGYTHPEVKELSGGDILSQVRSVLHGQAKIVPVAEDTTRVVTINSTTIAVNLDVSPKLPFDGAEVENHFGEGWAVLEKRADGLYVNGHKVILYLSERQKGGKFIGGYELRDELTGKPVLNANILDALLDNPRLIPEDWKKDEQGKTRYIFFWGTVYRGAFGSLCVRSFYFRVRAWFRSCRWLESGWGGGVSAASLASI